MKHWGMGLIIIITIYPSWCHEADLSLRENGKSIQRYNELNALVPLWLSRATEIEAKTVIEHLQNQKTSVLTERTMDAVIVAHAARNSISEKRQIDLT